MQNTKRAFSLMLGILLCLTASFALAQSGRTAVPEASEGTADYAAVEQAVSSAEEALSMTETYTQASLWALQAQVDGVEWGRPLSEQSAVDGYAASILAAISALKPRRTEEPAGFDEEKIVLRAGMMTDIHIGLNDGANHFTKALQMLNRQVSGNKLDALLLGGDLTDQTFITAQNSQITEFKSLLEAQIDPNQTAVFYTLGNHDVFDNYRVATTEQLIALFSDVFREGTDFTNRYFSHDLDKEAIASGNRHMVLGNYHFLSVNLETNCSCSAETLSWLDAKLSAITGENPDQYVFVLTHAPAYDTVWASKTDIGDRTYNSNLRSVLDKYPQTVCLSGHIHNDLNKESTIMQDTFTSVDLGGTNYAAAMTAAELTEDGHANVRPQGLANTTEYAQFCYMEIDENGNIRITRLDAYNDRVIGTWELKAPDAEGYFLEDYTKYRYYGIEAPAFTEDAGLTFVQDSYSTGTISFPTPKGDGLQLYKIQVERVSDGEVIAEVSYSANLFRYGRENLPEVCSFPLSALDLRPGDSYRFTVWALTEWMTESTNRLSCVFAPAGEYTKDAYYIDLTDEAAYALGHGNNVTASGSEQGVSLSMNPGRNADPYFYLDLSRYEIPVRQNVWAAFRIRTNVTEARLLQVRFLSTTGSDVSRAWWNYTADWTGDFQTVVYNAGSPTGGSAVDMLEGTLVSVRIDLSRDFSNDYIEWTEGSYFYIESAAFFMTEADALNYAGIGSAPPAAGVTDVSYAGPLEEGSALDASLLTGQTEVPGTFRFAEETLMFGTNDYTWIFIPDDLENYRTATGRITLTSQRDPSKRYAAYVDLGDPDEAKIGVEINVSIEIEGGTAKAVFPSQSVTDAYFSLDISDLGLNLGAYPVIALRLRADIENLQTDIRFITDNVTSWWAWQRLPVESGGQWVTLVFDLRQSQGFDTRDYAAGTYAALRFDLFNDGATDTLTLEEENYFEMESVAVFTDAVSAAAYAGIDSVTVSVTDVAYTGSLQAGAALDASLLTAQTSAAGNFSLEEGIVAAGTHLYRWTFTPEDVNLLPASGTIELTGITQVEPELGEVTYSGPLMEGEALDASLLTAEGGVPGTFAFEDPVLSGGTRSYAWTFTPEDTESYFPVSGNIELTAKYRPSVQNVHYAGKAVAGQAPDAGRLIAATDVAGTFAIEETLFAEGTAEYHWTFTPADERYGQISGTITVTAESPEDPDDPGSSDQPSDPNGSGCGGCGGSAAGGGLAGAIALLGGIAAIRRKRR